MSFASDLNQFRLKVQEQSNEFIQGIEIALFSAVIQDSPVDTGRFRGNWQYSTGAPAAGITGNTDPSGGQTINAMASFVQGLQGGRITFLVNNLPYAVPLEYGYSQQAPQGMVRRNVARFQALIQEESAKQ